MTVQCLFSFAGRKQRPKSMVIPSPTRLITLEEAKLRAYEEAQQELASFQLKPQKYIDVGPSDLPQYHTVIDLPKYNALQHCFG